MPGGVANVKAHDGSRPPGSRPPTPHICATHRAFGDAGRSDGTSASARQMVQESQSRLQAVISDEIARQAHATASRTRPPARR